MASIFTRIIAGELPGLFVWKDPRCVAFLSINPLTPGHTLVVPREEIDHWIDLPRDLAAHLVEVSRIISQALQRGFSPVKVGLMIAGLEVPHVHLHLVPIGDLGDLNFANADPAPRPQDLQAAAATIRRELRAMNHSEVAE